MTTQFGWIKFTVFYILLRSWLFPLQSNLGFKGIGCQKNTGNIRTIGRSAEDIAITTRRNPPTLDNIAGYGRKAQAQQSNNVPPEQQNRTALLPSLNFYY
ncbi:MAG: hypothetical protein H6569_01610 [Lewinellaceae bacterium]|nr:hypothetical protein [Lewinellaceae bacterium]